MRQATPRARYQALLDVRLEGMEARARNWLSGDSFSSRDRRSQSRLARPINQWRREWAKEDGVDDLRGFPTLIGLLVVYDGES